MEKEGGLMIIKMKECGNVEKYYRVKIKNESYVRFHYKRDISEKELKEKLTLIKHTLDVAEEYVSGDDMSCLAVGDIETIIEVYQKALSKIQIDVIFEEVSHEEVFEL